MKQYELKFRVINFTLIFFIVIIMMLLAKGWMTLWEKCSIVMFLLGIFVLLDAQGRFLEINDSGILIIKKKRNGTIKVIREIYWDQVDKVLTGKSGRERMTSVIPKRGTENKTCRLIIISSHMKEYKEALANTISYAKFAEIDDETYTQSGLERKIDK